MARLLTTCLIGASGVVALAWASYVQLAPRQTILTGEPDPERYAWRAWAEPQQASDAALAIDGRRRGKLPYAWLPVGPATLQLESRRPQTIAGAVVSWMGPPPSAAALQLGTRVLPFHAAGPDESVLWLDEPETVSRVSLELQASAAGVAEIQLLPDAATLWLVAPRAHADADLELLATYGAVSVARVPAEAELPRGLAQARAIVVSNVPLREGHTAQLRRYVEAGATLVELGPSSAICGAPALAEQTAPAGYVLDGLTGSGVRWPGAIASLPGCDAEGCERDQVAVSAQGGAPLVVSRPMGAGRCTRWLGDLRHAIQRLRQGDPARVDARKPSGLFASSEPTDVPSADRLGFALARQLTAAAGLDLLVSPLPAAGAGLVIYTADQDFVPGAGELARSEATRGAGMTLTLTAADIGGAPDIVYPEAKLPMLARSEVEQLSQRGHSVGIHPNLVGLRPEQYAGVITQHVQRFRERYGSAPRIARNHHLIWHGYTTMAETLARAGLRMELNYVSIPAGFMTGSGLPMQLSDSDGSLIPIFQQATQLDDSAYIPEDAATAQATTARLSARLITLLDIAQREHIPLTVLHHSHWWFHSAGKLQTTLISESNKRSLTVWGAAEWLRFTEARRSTRMKRKGSGYVVQVEADHMALLIEGADRVHVNGQPRELQAWQHPSGRYLLLPLERGTFLIEP